jgi:RsiW-degrading membrane proteinase PrsW (M82 family)
MENANAILFALFIGILPALFWLWFWLHEDKKSPEPKKLIARAFFAGMFAVPLVIPFQFLASKYFESYSIILFLTWATAEEFLKFGACFFAVFHRKELDEPIDAIIYMITAALGFVAVENTLFLLSPILESSPNMSFLNKSYLVDTIVIGNLRFVGASLLHIIASATVGIFIAFSFYQRPEKRNLYTIIGLIVAVALHTIFNLFIMSGNGSNTFIVFSVLWLGVIGLMLFFERVKSLVH